MRQWARDLKTELTALALAMRDPRVPWPVKLLAGAVVAYALSPVDLIPDFIPVLGYLDDLLLVPLGILLVRKLLPAERPGRLPAAGGGRSTHASPELAGRGRDRPDLAGRGSAPGSLALVVGGSKALIRRGA